MVSKIVYFYSYLGKWIEMKRNDPIWQCYDSFVSNFIGNQPLRSTPFCLGVPKNGALLLQTPTGCVASYESDNEFEWQEMPRAHRAKGGTHGHEEANRIFGLWLVNQRSHPHTPGRYPECFTNSLWRNSCLCGALGKFGVSSQGMWAKSLSQPTIPPPDINNRYLDPFQFGCQMLALLLKGVNSTHPT